MEHPGKGVALCPCVLWAIPAEGRENDISVRSIRSISEFQLCTSKCLEPPSFIAANDYVCKWPGGFCYCWCHYCTQHNPCLRAWSWPVSPGWDQVPCSQPFPASPDMPMAATSPWVPCTRISPQKCHLISLLGYFSNFKPCWIFVNNPLMFCLWFFRVLHFWLLLEAWAQRIWLQLGIHHLSPWICKFYWNCLS